ncbi:unnamed protein product [Bemisia tabaci]|uniref:ZP domain-containing protein n=1 Tax=Bemisia tabaci TaxID=7038 RepID=A0A9P0A5A6_BEMTA|nr:unnamed protein product [Bemisia tabaci]
MIPIVSMLNRGMGKWIWLGVLCCGIAGSGGQSNYADLGNSIEFPSPADGLPDSTVLDGRVTRLDDLSPIIALNRTKAALNCAAGFMQVELRFDEPFYGIVYADFDRASACKTAGRGTNSTRIELPLKGCGTKQDPQRVFTNNIVVRFHPGLEMDGDEVITIVCRYPPPIAPPPAGVPAPIIETPPSIPLGPPLKGFQILLIICGILFLSLVLLGLGMSYYCLKNQRVRVVRRHPLSMGTGSDITKLSGSSIGNISMFEGLKIPRAHAAATAGSTSGSEAALISGPDTIPSDYPSESPSSAHSEVEDVDTRSFRRSVSSGGSYDNKGYVQEVSSFYSENYGQFSETEVAMIPPAEPKFDVQLRVKRAPPPPPTPTPPPSDSEASVRLERNLTTILEREESFRSEAAQDMKTTFTFVPELHPPPRIATPEPQPIYSKILRRPPEITDSRYTSEIMERIQKKRSPPPPPVTSETYRSELDIQSTELIEAPVIPTRKPEITSHVVDDVFLRTITEKKTIEDIERHRRQVTEYHTRPAPPPINWDVTIRNYPDPNARPPSVDDTTTDWDSYSETSSAAGFPTTPKTERHLAPYTSKHHRSEIEIDRHYLSTLDIPMPQPPPTNWDVLVRVLEPPPTMEPSTSEERTYRVEQNLTLEDRKKWREIITTESTLRTLLTEATVREDYERIRKDQKYERLFEPEKWDIIIRVLAPEKPSYDQKGNGASNRYRRKQDWDTRSRRSSLPTLYEYDSDGGSSIRTLMADLRHGDPSGRSRRTSRSSLRSDVIDVRSMSEMTVDFAKPEHIDSMSDGSSYYRPRRFYDDAVGDDEEGSLVRSASQPSLARSASEFTEHWGLRRSWDVDSPGHSPRSSTRSSRDRHTRVESSYQHQQQRGWFDSVPEPRYK